MSPNNQRLVESLMDLAKTDPANALASGLDILKLTEAPSSSTEAQVFRALAYAARIAATMSESVEYAEMSVKAARVTDDEELLVGCLITLSGSLAIAGRNDEALEALTEADGLSSGLLGAEVAFQKAAVLARMGRSSVATDSLTRALSVFVEADDTELVAMTHHNRGMLLMEAGLIPLAIADLTKALSLFETLGFDYLAAGVEHSWGKALALEGDLPKAMSVFESSERRFVRLVGSAAEVQVSRCEVLLSAGLFAEAVAMAGSITSELRARGLMEDLAEAELVGGHAALLNGNLEEAVRHSRAAAELFRNQTRHTWAANATQVELSAMFEDGLADDALVTKARATAEMLSESGHQVAAFNARLTAGLASLAIGDADRAIEDLEVVADATVGSVELRLQSWLARSLIRDWAGNRRGALTAARAGMRLLGRYQAVLGATDIRVGVEKHARRLSDLGLKLAVESKKPRQVFDWMEQGRARALQLRPVTPPRDENQAQDLVALRQASLNLRSAFGEEAAKLARTERALQETIKARSRTLTPSSAVADSGNVAEGVSDALGEATLIEFAASEGSLWAVTARRGRFNLDRLCRLSEALRELRSLRFGLRGLSRGRGSAEQVKAVARRLDELVFAPLRLRDDTLVIIPTIEMYATPWSILPSLVGRSLTVSPSAETWLKLSSARRQEGGVVVTSGPDLEYADDEVRAVADIYSTTRVFTSEESAVADVLTAIDGASIAHIACHGVFKWESPMFSSLRLSDGDLNVYDIESLATPPGMIVLSACDAGFTETRPGEELLGLSAALLSIGTSTVVASIGLVPDSLATTDLMIEFHERIDRGVAPSVALAEAQAMAMQSRGGYIAAANFVCIGAS